MLSQTCECVCSLSTGILASPPCCYKYQEGVGNMLSPVFIDNVGMAVCGLSMSSLTKIRRVILFSICISTAASSDDSLAASRILLILCTEQYTIRVINIHSFCAGHHFNLQSFNSPCCPLLSFIMLLSFL